jgi:hypothetical protein
MIPSIVTEYAGARFRSRLEAKGACFFTLCGWRWEYEPPEQPGWIPDFLLIGATHTVKVEVKPIAWVGENETTIIQQAKAVPGLAKVREYARSVEPQIDDAALGSYAAGDEDVLILGAYPHPLNLRCVLCSDMMLGVFACERWGGPDLAMLAEGYPPHKLDFHAFNGAYDYRMGGQYEGGTHIQHCEDDDVDALWREAGNTVQWRRP